MRKRGLSDVVTTVLIILLVVVAVVAIGAYVTNLVNQGGRTVQREGACLGNTLKVEGCRQFISADTSAPVRTVISVTSATDASIRSVSQLSYTFRYDDGTSETFTSTSILPNPGRSSVSQDIGYLNKKPTGVQVGASYLLTDGKTISCAPTASSSCVTESSAQASFLTLSSQSLLVLGSIGSKVSNPVAGAGSTGSSAVSFIPFTSQCMGNSPNCFGISVMATCQATLSCYWNNPYAWYRFEEPSWTGVVGEVKDSTGAWNATAYGGVTTTLSSGRIGRVGDFNVTTLADQRVITNQAVTHNIGTGGFTWSAWVLRGTFSSLYLGVLGNGNYAPALYTAVAGLNLWGTYFATAGYYTPNALPATRWKHLVIVRAPGTNTVQFYEDGALISTQTVTSLSIANSQLALGSSGVSGSAWPLMGKLDDVRLYNRALSASEIRALYQNSIA